MDLPQGWLKVFDQPNSAVNTKIPVTTIHAVSLCVFKWWMLKCWKNNIHGNYIYMHIYITMYIYIYYVYKRFLFNMIHYTNSICNIDSYITIIHNFHSFTIWSLKSAKQIVPPSHLAVGLGIRSSVLFVRPRQPALCGQEIGSTVWTVKGS